MQQSERILNTIIFRILLDLTLFNNEYLIAIRNLVASSLQQRTWILYIPVNLAIFKRDLFALLGYSIEISQWNSKRRFIFTAAILTYSTFDNSFDSQGRPVLFNFVCVRQLMPVREQSEQSVEQVVQKISFSHRDLYSCNFTALAHFT